MIITDMNEFCLKKQQLDFLINHIKNERLILIFSQIIEKNRVVVKNYKTDKFILNLSDNEKEILLNELTYLLTAIGFDKNEEINSEGMLIEHLVDLFANS